MDGTDMGGCPFLKAHDRHTVAGAQSNSDWWLADLYA